MQSEIQDGLKIFRPNLEQRLKKRVLGKICGDIFVQIYDTNKKEETKNNNKQLSGIIGANLVLNVIGNVISVCNVEF